MSTEREASHTKLLDAFYTRHPVLVIAVYTCFVENTREPQLNADHILSVVELIEQRPVLAEVWWYARPAPAPQPSPPPATPVEASAHRKSNAAIPGSATPRPVSMVSRSATAPRESSPISGSFSVNEMCCRDSSTGKRRVRC
jgi:hypothetical protein